MNVNKFEWRRHITTMLSRLDRETLESITGLRFYSVASYGNGVYSCVENKNQISGTKTIIKLYENGHGIIQHRETNRLAS